VSEDARTCALEKDACEACRMAETIPVAMGCCVPAHKRHRRGRRARITKAQLNVLKTLQIEPSKKCGDHAIALTAGERLH